MMKHKNDDEKELLCCEELLRYDQQQEQQQLRQFKHYQQQQQQHLNQQHLANINSNIQPDPVYLEDQAFFNLILKESSAADINNVSSTNQQQPALAGQLRHSLLSWMLNICEHQLCQDEIFPLATMILDKFLLLHNNNQQKQQSQIMLCCAEELRLRQLYLFAACSILLATKLRQTPKLYIQSLIEFSRNELLIELNREEILDGELLILATLKWDLASLVTPNEFIAIILDKCQNLLAATNSSNSNKQQQHLQQQQNTNTNANSNANANQQHGSMVRRHTQSLLELCLMGK